MSVCAVAVMNDGESCRPSDDSRRKAETPLPAENPTNAPSGVDVWQPMQLVPAPAGVTMVCGVSVPILKPRSSMPLTGLVQYTIAPGAETGATLTVPLEPSSGPLLRL